MSFYIELLDDYKYLVNAGYKNKVAFEDVKDALEFLKTRLDEEVKLKLEDWEK